MPLINASADVLLLTCLAVLVPTVYCMRVRRVAQDRNTPPYRTLLSYVLTAHTIYVIYNLLICWPPNIFQRLHIPLTMSADAVRTALVHRAGLAADATLPPPLETLLGRLSSFDTRMLYVRFGQSVVQDCEHCTTFDEYALAALPRALREYVRAAAVLGVLTVRGGGREAWRAYAVGALVCVAVVEAYAIATVQVTIPRDGLDVFMWHDNLWFLRQLAFLAIPALMHLPRASVGVSPPASPAAISATLQQTGDTLQQTLGVLTVLRIARTGIMRDPALAGRARMWWGAHRREGECMRADEAVRRVAERTGLGFADEGARLKVKAEGVARELVAGLVAAGRAGAQ